MEKFPWGQKVGFQTGEVEWPEWLLPVILALGRPHGVSMDLGKDSENWGVKRRESRRLDSA